MMLLLLLSSCKSPSGPDNPTPGTISGTVTNASDSTPIVGASVSTSPATSTVTTDAQGKFTITNVAPKTYTVTATAAGFTAGSVSATVTAGQTATANLALVSTTGTIGGTVTNASNSTPIVGASVSTSPATSTVTTDTYGKYTISNVAPGFYTVTITAAGFTAGSVGATVVAGQTVTANLALQLARGTISGTITNLSNAIHAIRQRRASDGTPIVGASVSTQPATQTVTTDSQGRYTINNVLPGTYTVTATANGYIAGSASAVVVAGQTVTANLSLQADYSGSWNGTTSQGKTISFTVVNNTITAFTFGFHLVGAGVTTDGTLTVSRTPPWAITGNTFQVTGTSTLMTWPTTIKMSYTFNCTFTSLTTATGTANFAYTQGTTGSADATWTANK